MRSFFLTAAAMVFIAGAAAAQTNPPMTNGDATTTAPAKTGAPLSPKTFEHAASNSGGPGSPKSTSDSGVGGNGATDITHPNIPASAQNVTP